MLIYRALKDRILKPNNQIIYYKQIRKFRAPNICSDCTLIKNGCQEGYYGIRLYKTEDVYKIGYCIQRMDKVSEI